ncbi:MAG: hypothetical protein ACJ74H_04280 [Thermoanaerobaculia bacterium]
MQRDFSTRAGWPIAGELSARLARIPSTRFFDITALCTRDRQHSGGRAGEERSGAHRG